MNFSVISQSSFQVFLQTTLSLSQSSLRENWFSVFSKLMFEHLLYYKSLWKSTISLQEENCN